MWIHLFVEHSIYSLRHILVPLLDSLMLTRVLCFFNGMDILVEASKCRGVLHIRRVLFALCFCALGIDKLLILIFSFSLSSAVGLSTFHPLT